MKWVLAICAALVILFAGGCAFAVNSWDSGNPLTLFLLAVGAANVVLILAIFQEWRWTPWLLYAFGAVDIGLTFLWLILMAEIGGLALVGVVPLVKGVCEIVLAWERTRRTDDGRPPA